MSEKSEKASPKRIARAKKQGHVAQSKDLARAFLLLSTLSFLYFFASLFKNAFEENFHLCFVAPKMEVQEALKSSISLFIRPLFALCAFSILLLVISFLIQRGWVFSLSKKRKESPFVLYPFLKLVMLIAIGCATFPHFLTQARISLITPIALWPQMLFKELYQLALWVALGFLALGVIDLFYQRWRLQKELSMTREEKREELREENLGLKQKVLVKMSRI